MSELRIALVAEGPTDYEIIKAALQAFLPRSFVMTTLQPEATRPVMGTGWGGVLKWCHAAGQRHAGPLHLDPTLAGFDLLIVHLDADVAGKQYADCGPAAVSDAQTFGWAALPCAQPCPPVTATCARLEITLDSWLCPATKGQRALYCVPAQSSGTWLAAAVLPADHALLVDAQCDERVESDLAQLPLFQRIKKTTLEYRRHSARVCERWHEVKRLCSQAQHFEQTVLACLGP